MSDRRSSGVSCSICKKSKRTFPKLKIFQLPSREKNDVLHCLWMQACNFKNEGNYSVCEDHFRSDFIGRKYLKRAAVPSLNLNPNLDLSLSSKQKRTIYSCTDILLENCAQPQFNNPIKIFDAETEIQKELEIEATPAHQESNPPSCPPSIFNKCSVECTTITHNNDSPLINDGAQREVKEKSTDWDKQNKTAIQCVTKILKVTANRDKYSVFGEVLAQNIRNSCKDIDEIDIAKKLVENVLTNLLSGVYVQGTG